MAGHAIHLDAGLRAVRLARPPQAHGQPVVGVGGGVQAVVASEGPGIAFGILVRIGSRRVPELPGVAVGVDAPLRLEVAVLRQGASRPRSAAVDGASESAESAPRRTPARSAQTRMQIPARASQPRVEPRVRAACVPRLSQDLSSAGSTSVSVNRPYLSFYRQPRRRSEMACCDGSIVNRRHLVQIRCLEIWIVCTRVHRHRRDPGG